MGAEVRQVYHGVADFTSVSPEHCIILSPVNLASLLDIELCFFSLPAADPIEQAQAFIGPKDYRFYLNDLDLTVDLKAELVRMITAVPKALRNRTYLQGVRRYLKIATKIVTLDAAAEMAAANVVANADDWTQYFRTLGDRKTGWSGNLNPISFLYRSIPIRPISISTLLESYYRRNAIPDEKPLSTFLGINLLFSQGPSPSATSSEYDPVGTFPGGRLNYSIESLYRNPLEPQIKAIDARLKALHQSLDRMRVNYLDEILERANEIKIDVTQSNNSMIQNLDRLEDVVKEIAEVP